MLGLFLYCKAFIAVLMLLLLEQVRMVVLLERAYRHYALSKVNVAPESHWSTYSYGVCISVRVFNDQTTFDSDGSIDVQ